MAKHLKLCVIPSEQKAFLSLFDQIQTLVDFEGMDFGAGDSFLSCSLSVHGEVNLDYSLVFQQLQVYDRSVTFWFLGCS